MVLSARASQRLHRAAIVMAVTSVCLASAAPAAASSGDVMRPAQTQWVWPTAAPHRLVRGFEAPASRYSAGHRGIDIVASGGTSVVAPAAGEVYFAGRVVDRPIVTLDVGGDLLISVEPVEARVSVGDHVDMGAPIGVVSRGGHCDARCVHLGVRLNGEYVSALLYLGGIERAILLPMSSSR